jgi:hypothetical protein
MGNRNRTGFAVEALEDRSTPSPVLVPLGGFNASVYLFVDPGNGNPGQTVYRLVTPGTDVTPTEPMLQGLLRSIQGGAGG